MRIFKTKIFHNWAKKIGLNDRLLRAAIDEIECGKCVVSLGSYLYKKRIAFCDRGKRGGLRSIIALKHQEKAFFVYGFAKNQKDNLSEDEVVVYKELAKLLLSLSESQIVQAIKRKKIIEV